MAGKDIIAMTQEELTRLHLIRQVLDKHITQTGAAALIGVGVRQVQRIIHAVRLQGDKGIIHKSRGKASNRALPDAIKDKALKLYQEKYHDFGPTLASEKLFEINKIKLNDETLRLWLIEEHIPYKQRKKRPHRSWRQRRDCFGEMVQMDGSHHDWLEGRGPECVFMGYIDDATGRPFGKFYPYEGTLPAMESFKRYIRRYGIPMSIYLDKHSTYKSAQKQSIEDELNNIESLSQFGRAVKELGVNVIYADSPQAKGRIERLFNTFQNRVVKEMRLAGINTIEEANKFMSGYLPVYSRRFAVTPANDTDLHRPLPQGINLDKVLCIKTPRVLRNDYTIAHNTKLYQIEDSPRAKDVTVEERVDGSMLIIHKGVHLRFKEITTRPAKAHEAKQEYPLAVRPRGIHAPSKDHPWKQYRQLGSLKLKEEVLAGAL